MASGDDPLRSTLFHSESKFVVAFRSIMQTAHAFLEKQAIATCITTVPFSEIEDVDSSMRNATDSQNQLRVEIVSTISSFFYYHLMFLSTA